MTEDAEKTPSPQPALRKVMVVFDYVRHDGSSGTSRVFLNGVANIRTEQDVEMIERLIRNNGSGLLSVMITNWKSLEG